MITLGNRQNRNSRTPSARRGRCASALAAPVFGAGLAWFGVLLPSPALAVREPQVAPAVPSAASGKDPRYDGILRMLGAGAFEPAVASSRVMLRQDPADDRAAALAGIALCKLKRHEEAKPYLLQARDSARVFPERVHAAHFLGWCTYHLGELDESRAAFERHLRDVPGEPDSTFGLGVIALSEDRLDDAERFFRAALDGFTKPAAKPADQSRVLVRMSDLALRRDQPIEAEALLDRAAQANPLQPETWAKLARVRDRLGQHAKADAARANERRILEARAARGARPATAPDGAPPAQPGSETSGPVETPPVDKPRTPAIEKPQP